MKTPLIFNETTYLGRVGSNRVNRRIENNLNDLSAKEWVCDRVSVFVQKSVGKKSQ
jgi:hypothetical protein